MFVCLEYILWLRVLELFIKHNLTFKLLLSTAQTPAILNSRKQVIKNIIHLIPVKFLAAKKKCCQHSSNESTSNFNQKITDQLKHHFRTNISVALRFTVFASNPEFYRILLNFR